MPRHYQPNNTRWQTGHDVPLCHDAGFPVFSELLPRNRHPTPRTFWRKYQPAATTAAVADQYVPRSVRRFWLMSGETVTKSAALLEHMLRFIEMDLGCERISTRVHK